MPGKRIASLLPAMAEPHAAVAAMVERVDPTTTERVDLLDAIGRVLATQPRAERDSPSADVSAVDGYAVAHASLPCKQPEPRAGQAAARLPVAFTVTTGQNPPALPDGQVARVFTGGVVPQNSDAVIRRELVEEASGAIALSPQATEESMRKPNVRRRGENLRRGEAWLGTGVPIKPATLASLAAQGHATPCVFRKLKIGLAITGNELAAYDQNEPETPLVRDSNGPGLSAMLNATPWCAEIEARRLTDDPTLTRKAITSLIKRCDAVISTGGISMGDHDYLPDALIALDAEIIYHHLAMRPGKPNLGAIVDGKPVVALPGNPVSALVGAVVLAGPVLRSRAGYADPLPRHRVEVFEPQAHDVPLNLWHYRLANRDVGQPVRRTPYRGSGDVVALGRSRGFYEVPPNEPDALAPRFWYDWSFT